MLIHVPLHMIKLHTNMHVGSWKKRCMMCDSNNIVNSSFKIMTLHEHVSMEGNREERIANDCLECTML